MSVNSNNIVVERVKLARAGKNPTVITKMESGWVVMGDNQTIPGYTILIADPIVDDINKLDAAKRSQFLADMTIIGDALLNVLNAKLVNYSILGNQDVGLHVHIHPRYEWEKEELRKSPPWKYGFVKEPVVMFDFDRDHDVMQKIKTEIDRLLQIG